MVLKETMKKYVIHLLKEEVEQLRSIINRGSHSSQTFHAAYILLNCDEGKYSDKVTNDQISKVLKVGMRTIDRIKKRFMEEVSLASGVPQGQYSRIENGKVEPAVSTLDKLAKVFEVSITEFFKSDDLEDSINLPLLEKVKLIDTLGDEEKTALFKMIDLAISNKKMKDNLQSIISS